MPDYMNDLASQLQAASTKAALDRLENLATQLLQVRNDKTKFLEQVKAFHAVICEDCKPLLQINDDGVAYMPKKSKAESPELGEVEVTITEGVEASTGNE